MAAWTHLLQPHHFLTSNLYLSPTKGDTRWRFLEDFHFTSSEIDAPRKQTLSASSHVAMNHVLSAARAACGCLRALWPSLFTRQLRTQGLLRRAVAERGNHSAKARLPCHSHMPLPQSSLSSIMNVMRLTTQTVIPGYVQCLLYPSTRFARLNAEGLITSMFRLYTL